MPWYPQRTICHAEKERQAALRIYHMRHEDAPYHDGSERSWAKEASASHPYHYLDGVSVWVAPVDVNPGDQFLSDSPVDVAGLAEQFERQHDQGDDGSERAEH